jgi:hypothetical protein
MLRETIANVRVDLSEGHARVSKVEVVLPAFQVPVQLLNQLRDRLRALSMIGHLVQLFPLLLQGLCRRAHIQIPATRALAGPRSPAITSAGDVHLLTDGKSIYLEEAPNRIIDLLKNGRQPMFLVCVTDQARRLCAAANRKPARSETAAAVRKARAV